MAPLPSEPSHSTPADKPLLAVLKGERRDPPPIWLMRQAGRYLPEYRALRAEKGGFLDLVYDPAAAAEITLQPLKRFAFDGAILFSDILIVPFAIGQNLSFVAGEGPRLTPPMGTIRIRDLEPVMQRLDPIYETVRRVKAELDPSTTFLGFAGSPWTVATYMIAGQGSREQAEARRLAYTDPGKVDRDPRSDRDHDGRLSVASDRGRSRCGATVRQLGGQPRAGPVRSLCDQADRVDRRPIEAAPSGRSDHRLSQGRGRKARRLCRAKPGSMRSASTRRSIRRGRRKPCPPQCRCRAISIRSR